MNVRWEAFDRPFHTKVVGVMQPGRQQAIAVCRAGHSVRLLRERDNPVDANAILVCRADGTPLGHLSRELAADMAPQLDAGARFDVQISDVTGGTPDKPTHGVNLLITSVRQAP